MIQVTPFLPAEVRRGTPARPSLMARFPVPGLLFPPFFPLRVPLSCDPQPVFTAFSLFFLFDDAFFCVAFDLSPVFPASDERGNPSRYVPLASICLFSRWARSQLLNVLSSPLSFFTLHRVFAGVIVRLFFPFFFLQQG